MSRSARYFTKRAWEDGSTDGDDRASGPAADRSSYGSFASFNDPDGNGWLLQEVTTRLPGRVDAATTSFASASDLARALGARLPPTASTRSASVKRTQLA